MSLGKIILSVIVAIIVAFGTWLRVGLVGPFADRAGAEPIEPAARSGGGARAPARRACQPLQRQLRRRESGFRRSEGAARPRARSPCRRMATAPPPRRSGRRWIRLRKRRSSPASSIRLPTRKREKRSRRSSSRCGSSRDGRRGYPRERPYLRTVTLSCTVIRRSDPGSAACENRQGGLPSCTMMVRRSFSCDKRAVQRVGSD